MDDFEKKEHEIKSNLSRWLSNPLNLSLAAILIFAFVVRFYYFLATKLQPLWWDEAVYGTLAKNYISHMWDGTDVIVGETIIRPFLFPWLWSILLRLGFNEVGVRFMLELVPSVLSIFLVYLVAKELYGKKVGLISAFIFSSLWIHLFYTSRLLTNLPASVLLLTSMLFFLKFLKSKSNFRLFSISLFLLSLATLMRYPLGIFFIVFLVLLIPDKKLQLNKIKFWVSGIIGMIPILLFFIINKIKYGNIFPALFGDYLQQSQVDGQVAPIAFHLLNYISLFLSPDTSSIFYQLFFIAFIIGMVIILFELVVGYNFIFRSRKIKNHLFVITSFVFFYAFFIFYMRSAEDRWLLPIAFIMTTLSAGGIVFIASLIKKYSKILSIIFLLVVLLTGAYAEIKFGDMIIENKKSSYLQIRQGFEWIKQNTPSDAIIIGSGIQPYAPYYGDRKFLNIPDEINSSQIIEADYLVAHLFTPQPEYINKYLSDNKDKWLVANAFFFDAEQQQVALVIYKNKQKNN